MLDRYVDAFERYDITSLVSLLRESQATPGPVAVPLADDLGTQFRAEADRTLAAWRACDLDGSVDIGAGPMPAAIALSVNLASRSAVAAPRLLDEGHPTSPLVRSRPRRSGRRPVR